MNGRFFQRTAGLLVVLALLLGIFGSSLPSVAASSSARASLPGYFDDVGVATQQWAQQPPGQQAEAIAAVVHLDMAPMAVVGKGWSHQQRIAYMRQIQAAQDALIPQIIALGGTVEGRLTQAAVGLAVSINSSQVGQLGRLGTVAAVRRVHNYRLAATPALATQPVSRAIERLPVDGRGVQIAVIDTGVDYTHKKLGGPGTTAAFAAAYCGDGTIPPERVNPTCGTAHELPSAPKRSGRFGDVSYGRDPANPAPKVVGGWDWVGEVWPNPDPRCPDANGRPTPCLAQDANPIDYYGHGTQIADIIAGLETSPGANDAGMAPGAGLWAFKACSAITGECNGTALLLAIDDALDLDDSDYGACTPGGSRPQDRFCLAYDPADVINLSLGSNYGQPEDDLTLFVNMASYYGSLVVAAAGNDGDRPYIVSSPSTAEAALSVGQTNGVGATIFTVRSADLALPAIHQPWSAPITTDLRAAVQYGDGAGGNLTGCSAFAAPQPGRALLLDRGGCDTSLKAANASAAGAALALIADTQQANTPLLSSYDGGSISLPALTLTKADGDRLKALLQAGPTSEVRVVASESTTRPSDMAASSSRGPRIADNDIKPDLSAPGGFFAATARSGAETSFISGTSASAPVVAGTAALMIQELKRFGFVGQSSGLAVPCNVATGCPEGLGGRISLVPLLKSVLMNSADPNLTVGGELLAPITLQGSGEVDPRATFRQRTVAWDVTDLNNYLRREIRDPACAVNPVVDVLNFIFNPSIPPRCALNFPFGNEFFRTWNAQTGSLSFGFDTVSGSRTITRKLVIANTSAAERTYRLSSNFRYESDRNRGVTVTISPTTVLIPGRGNTVVDVTMRLAASGMREWTLNGGRFGGSGTDIFCTDLLTCPTLTEFEIDGYITIDGGEPNVARVPWQVLPRRAASVFVSSVNDTSMTLRNMARFKEGAVDSFALVDLNPINCWLVRNGACQIYSPGMLPGSNQSPVDLNEVGLRSYVDAGVNQRFGLPAPPAGATADEVVAFGLTVYDAPFRASPNVPAKFEVHVDGNRDGVYDYVVFNADLNLEGERDGRSAVFVKDVNPADGTQPTRPFYFTDVNFNSQNWILPVPAAAIGVNSSQPFNFYVLAFDAYFGGRPGYRGLWDCSPGAGRNCGSTFHTFQTSQPKFVNDVGSFQVPVQSSYRYTFSRSASGAQASPSQIGFLFLYRDARTGRESDSVELP